MATEVGTLHLKVDTSGVKAGEAAVERLGDAAQNTTAKTEKLSSSARKSNVTVGDFGRKAGMAGVQLEQLAGQIAMGQNPMRALGVQAADLGFVLGAPLLGAVVGIGAAIGSVLIPMLLQGADSAEELVEKMDDLGLVFNEMSAAQQAVFLMDMNDSLKELDESTAAATERMEELQRQRERLQTRRRGQAAVAAEIAELNEEETRLQATIDTNQQIREKLVDTLNDESKAQEAVNRARDAEIEAADKYLDRIMGINDNELEAFKRKELEMITTLMEFRDKKLISEQEYQDAINEIVDAGVAYRVDAAEKEFEEEMKKRQERTDRLHSENDRLMDDIIARDEKRKESARMTTDTLLAFEDVLLKGKSEKEKAAFRMAVNLANAEKRENAKNIISNSYDAAMKAYKALAAIPIIGPALGAAAAATIIAAGVSFAAQSLQGRALGGQVRAGESYVVGERGPEILTMGTVGRITPNSALGQAAGGVVNKTANVTFNIAANDTEGFDELLINRRGLIINMINDAIEDQGRAAIV